MNCFHPGDFNITERAIELCGFKKGDRLLELGCGDGLTMEYLKDKFGIIVTGCDTSDNMLLRAKARNPELHAIKCDGIALDFPSLSFDGAYMECSFSLMERHLELLHELFCVLKPGAKIAISDLYMLEPDYKRANEHKRQALEFLNKPRKHNDCESITEYPSPCLLDGMFIKEFLYETLAEAGFTPLCWEDRTQELRNYVAQVLMDYGSFENMRKVRLPENSQGDATKYCNAEYGKNTGYFLLTAEKKIHE